MDKINLFDFIDVIFFPVWFTFVKQVLWQLSYTSPLWRYFNISPLLILFLFWFLYFMPTLPPDPIFSVIWFISIALGDLIVMVVPHVFLCWISPPWPACITLTPPTVLDSSVNSDAFHQVPAALGRAPVQFAHQVRSGVLLLPPTVVVLLTYLPAATHVTSAVAWGPSAGDIQYDILMG